MESRRFLLVAQSILQVRGVLVLAVAFVVLLVLAIISIRFASARPPL